MTSMQHYTHLLKTESKQLATCHLAKAQKENMI